MHEITRIIEAARLMNRGVLVTVIRTEGSTYRRAGARVLISEEGKAVGAISGGCLEKDLAERVRAWLSTDNGQRTTDNGFTIRYDSTRSDDLVFGLGLGCRGILDLLVEPFDASHPLRLANEFRWNGREPVEWTTTLPDGEVMVEVIRPEPAIVVFGGGPDVEPVVRLAQNVGWRADVVTTREPIDVGDYDAAVVMTHNFPRDVDVLRMLLESRIGYIGLLGPRTRGDELLAEIGATRDARIHNPIGLDLGGETPEDIALSIVAEIQQVLQRRSGRPLRELDVPIHTPANIPTCA